MLVRLPTGDALNYLGSGAYGFNPYAIVSYQWRVSPHARLGYLWNTSTVLIPNPNGGNLRLPGGLEYDLGADASLIKRVGLAADFFGNQFINSPTLTPGTAPNNVPGVPAAPTLIPRTTSYNINYFSFGLKVNPVGNLLLYGNMLIQLNNNGLRSNIVPLAGISYKF